MVYKKDNSERDDLIHLLTETIQGEGYDVDHEVEAEIRRLAKFVVVHNNFDEDDGDIEDSESNFYGDDELFDEYGDEEDEPKIITEDME
jgi:hypothetical protein